MFTQPITIAVEAGGAEQVLFCRIYNPASGQAVFAIYPEQVNWQDVIAKANVKIDAAHGRVGQPEQKLQTAQSI